MIIEYLSPASFFSIKSTISSNAPLVPEPSSLDTTMMVASSPPTSFQLVISPVNILVTVFLSKAFTWFEGCVTTAMPSNANTYSVKP